MKINYKKRRAGIVHYPWAIHDIDRKQMVQLARFDEKIKRERILYIHIPFCDHICSFCYYPAVQNERLLREKYIEALAIELELYGTHLGYEQNPIEAVYIGGGTPSSLTVSEIQLLFDHMRHVLNLDHVKEITFEANPASLTLEKLQVLNNVGVNRISLGVQTFNPQYARNIGLLQTPWDSLQAIENTYKIGIPSVSVDLMYNLPGQTADEWEADIELVQELGVGHVTLYPLRILPNLGLSKKIQDKILPPCGKLNQEIDFFVRACKILETAGYRLETTYDLALPGHSHYYARKHFIEHLDLTALGIGAYGEINGYIYRNVGNINDYIKILKTKEFPVQKGYQVKDTDLPGKAMAMGLRFLEVNIQEFWERFQEYPQDIFAKELENLVSWGLVNITKKRIALTRMDGIIWGNNAALEFCDKFFRDSYSL